MRFTDADMWEAVQARDARFDGRFVYAVSTTRIFCRPSCGSRRPHRQHVHFYSSAGDATSAGFRACRRCKPDQRHGTRAARAVETARKLLDKAANSGESQSQTRLPDLAAATGVSAFHLQRHFTRLIGVSPHAYLRKRRADLMRSHLRKGATVLHATYESGFSSPGSAYASAKRDIGMTPAQYKRAGADEQIRYTIADSAVGRLLVATTRRGICAVMLGASDETLLDQLRAEFPRGALKAGGSGDRKIVEDVLRVISGQVRHIPALDIDATPFQWKVWEALRKIPFGETRTYGDIARTIGRPRAARAVGRACATNPAAVVIPCHRVVRADGATGEYRWGAELKRELLARERRKA